MKKSLLTLGLALALLPLPLVAEVQSPYLETFDNVDVSSDDFHPAGWGHKYRSEYYTATWTLVDISETNKALRVSQYNTYDAYADYLITPVVSGRVTMKVKNSYDSTAGSIRFYKIAEPEPGGFTKGEELTPDIMPELTGEFQEVGFANLEEGTRLGIHGHNVTFDDFSAATADVVLLEKLNLGYDLESSVPAFTNTGTSYNPAYSITMDATGSLQLTLAVELENQGETTFTTGDADYTLTLSSGDTELGTVPVRTTLAPGQSASESYTFTITDASALSGRMSFTLRENATGDSDWQTITIVPYRPEFTLRSIETTSGYNNISNGETLDFGSLNSAATENVYVYNTGTAPMTFTMTVGDGFTATSESPLTLEAGEHLAVAIAPEVDTTFGPRAAGLQFAGEGISPFTLNLKANMLDPSLWFENFAGSRLPDDMIAEASWSYSTAGANISANTDGKKLITPKLTVREGETLSAKVRKSGNSYYDPTFKVYKSTDRATWQEVTVTGDVADLGTTYEDFTVSGIEPGDWYIGIAASYLNLAELYGFRKAEVAHDVYVTGANLPETAEVNTATSASISVRNVGPQLEQGSYTVALLVDGRTVATDTPAALAPGEQRTFTLSFTPHHTAGAATVQMQLLSGNDVIASSEAGTLTINAEVVKNIVQVGNKTTTTDNKTPVSARNKYSYSDMIYKADKLGLAAGAKINRIAFTGNCTATGISGNVKVWIENTDVTDVPLGTNVWADLQEPATVEIAEWDCPVVTDGELLVLDLSETPFTYTGSNLRLRFKSEMTSTGAAQFHYDRTSGYAGYDYDSSATYVPKTYNASTPVLYLGIQADPVTATGTVTSAETAQPVSGAEVTVSSGDVEYYGTTDARGRYNVQLLKEMEGYTVNVTAPGYFPASLPLAAVTDGTATTDIALATARDLYIKSQNVPATGTVNYTQTISALVQNVNTTEFAAGSYNVVLTDNGEEIAFREGVALAANNAGGTNAASEHLYTFDFTPYVAGEHQLQVVAKWGYDDSFAQAPSTMNVGDEVTEGEDRFGEPNGFVTNAPVVTFFNYSTSQTVYPAEKINIPAGSDITRLAYNGYFSGYNNVDISVSVYMQNVANASGDPVFDTEGMTPVAQKDFRYGSKGSQYGAVEMLDFDLAEPFKYEGGALRIVIRCNGTGSTTNFESDSSGTAYFKQNDNSWEALDAQTPKTCNMPVAYITYRNVATFAGRVSDSADNSPIEGARLMLTSGNVKYEGTTDATGAFEIPVVQRDLPFTLTITAKDYLPLTIGNVDPSENNEYRLTVDPSTGIDAIEGENSQKHLFNLQGVPVDESYRGIKVGKGVKKLENR